MKIDVVASEPHYMRHMLPIWSALPDEMKGIVHPLCEPGFPQRPQGGRIAMVAGWQDVHPLRGLCPMIYVEHGAGQVYVDKARHPSYSGGGDRHVGVVGYVCPSETVAQRWSKPAVAVGCPKLDRWHSHQTVFRQGGFVPNVCFAWHWDCHHVPETRSAWAHYSPQLSEIVHRFEAQGFGVAGHAHPKWRGDLDVEMAQVGMRVLEEEPDVFFDADILIVDNSSLAYEFAALGRPVILLNAPWYRRDVEHGLRFWSNVPGVQVDGPEELLGMNLWDLIHPTGLWLEAQARAHLAATTTYAHIDGSSSRRAAEWMSLLLSEV